MNIKPSENTKLYGLGEYFNEILNLHNQKKMPNKILLSGRKGIGKSTLAYHLINHIISLEDDDFKYNLKEFMINKDNTTFKLIKNKTHPNFYLIDLMDEKKNIDIDQIRKMIIYTNKSAFNDNPRFILIDNIENLNTNSVNALLKIVEEPNNNIYFILIHNNEKKILSTLKSRCLIFKVNMSFDGCINTANLLLKRNIFELVNNELISYYSTPGIFIKLINFAQKNEINLNDYTLINFLILLIDMNYYKKNKFIKNIIINFIKLKFFNEYKLSKKKDSIVEFYHKFFDKIKNAEKFNLDEESLFIEFKSKLLNG